MNASRTTYPVKVLNQDHLILRNDKTVVIVVILIYACYIARCQTPICTILKILLNI